MDRLKQGIILFDLDGTLTDSKDGIIRSVQYMQKKLGLRVWSEEELYFIVGPPLIQSFANEFGMAPDAAEAAVEIFRERYATIGLFENSVFPGVTELLAALQEKGKRLAVATSKMEDLAVRILEHFGIADYFEVIGGNRRELGRDTKAKVIQYVLSAMHEIRYCRGARPRNSLHRRGIRLRESGGVCGTRRGLYRRNPKGCGTVILKK